MGFIDALNHLLNFAAPALGLAVLLALASWALERKRPVALSAMARLAINFVVGVMVLAAGLVLLGRDGKMLTYLLLALAMAACQWWQLGGWKM